MDKLTRRDLIKKTAAGSAALAVTGMPSCSTNPLESSTTEEGAKEGANASLKNIRLIDYHPKTVLTVKKTEIQKAKYFGLIQSFPLQNIGVRFLGFLYLTPMKIQTDR